MIFVAGRSRGLAVVMVTPKAAPRKQRKLGHPPDANPNPAPPPLRLSSPSPNFAFRIPFFGGAVVNCRLRRHLLAVWPTFWESLLPAPPVGTFGIIAASTTASCASPTSDTRLALVRAVQRMQC